MFLNSLIWFIKHQRFSRLLKRHFVIVMKRKLCSVTGSNTKKNAIALEEQKSHNSDALLNAFNPSDFK